MSRKLNLISATLALMTILLMCALANAQPQFNRKPTPKLIINNPESNPQDRAVSPEAQPANAPCCQTEPANGDLNVPVKATSRERNVSINTSAKGWDGKVQGKQLSTEVVVIFDNPNDYDSFAAGNLRLNLILKNMVSGQTITLGSNLLTENFRPSADKKSIAINVVIDNMSAPLSEAACGQITPSAENTRDGSGVNITLSYSGCGSPSAQPTTGNPVTGVIVHGGKNPGGNLSINLGDSRIVTREAAAGLAGAAGTIIISSSKGVGSTRNREF